MATQNESIQCIGIIMDGNRRWAKDKGLPTLEGHRRGAKVFADTVRWIRDTGIPHAVFYAFSSENWNRSEEEVAYLVGLFEEQLSTLNEKLQNDGEGEQKVRFRFIGDLGQFSASLQQKMREIERESAQYDGTTIWIALSYGGRDEIVNAVNTAVEKGKQVADEHDFRSLLWSEELPDPDIILRTGGQKRLSNFMTWHSVYSELFFIDTLWPSFSTDELARVVGAYEGRVRNFGT